MGCVNFGRLILRPRALTPNGRQRGCHIIDQAFLIAKGIIPKVSTLINVETNPNNGMPVNFFEYSHALLISAIGESIFHKITLRSS